ncbi:hypothetical protein RB653_001534 [Dictyostelium firmibasis]|uniref:Uncharacterized protein n=1 Tax=Dictyostelium firmibasis TaxID=79012 RepID=A0AAN7U585_9MYCE
MINNSNINVKPPINPQNIYDLLCNFIEQMNISYDEILILQEYKGLITKLVSTTSAIKYFFNDYEIEKFQIIPTKDTLLGKLKLFIESLKQSVELQINSFKKVSIITTINTNSNTTTSIDSSEIQNLKLIINHNLHNNQTQLFIFQLTIIQSLINLLKSVEILIQNKKNKDINAKQIKDSIKQLLILLNSYHNKQFKNKDEIIEKLQNLNFQYTTDPFMSRLINDIIYFTNIK